MNENVYKFEHRDVIEQEAGEWLIRLDGTIRLRKRSLKGFRIG